MIGAWRQSADVSQNGAMTDPELAPRRVFPWIAGVWGLAAAAAIAVSLLAPLEWRMAWMIVALGAVIFITFAVHLWVADARGFIDRVALSAAGALLIMGIVSAVFGLATLIPGSVFAG